MSQFTIRVYGIAIKDGQVLLSREGIKGGLFVKFPGGGLEYGEGTRACLEREIKEETGLHAETGEHIYTTDFFQPSAFHDAPVQVVSIYYAVQLIKPDGLKTVSSESKEPGFFWCAMEKLTANLFDLPIDQYVAEKLWGDE